MPTFLEISIVPVDVAPLPIRRFCIRADASYRELHDAIMILTGWPDSSAWFFEICESASSDIELRVLPERLRAGVGVDPEVTPLSHYIDPDHHLRRLFRYYHDADVRWRVDVVAEDRWEVLDDRRQWLVRAHHPWPPYEIEGPLAYGPVLEAALSGHDPDGLLDVVARRIGWSPAFDVDALAARFEADPSGDVRP